MADKPLLLEAHDIITGDRQAHYGDPAVLHAQIGLWWQPILRVQKIEPIQVAQCMMALKLLRSINDPTYRDNYVDIAGYAGLTDYILGKIRP